MEENVSLDTSKSKLLVKSAIGIRKLLIEKSGGKLKKDKLNTIKDGKVKRRKLKNRGLVYLSHIPHGFYEHQMTQYFKQFGVVTNCRVIRSKRTGNSKGCAFIEFKNTSVAEIVAETMNNYLMGKRLLKAAYIPPEEQRRKVMRKKWNTIYNPGNVLRQKMKLVYNETKDDAGELQRARKLITNFLKTKKKLKELGIDYDFFTPVDVPPVLMKMLVKKESESSEEKNIKNNIKPEEKKSNIKEEYSTSVKDKVTVQKEVKKQVANTEKIERRKNRNKSKGLKEKLSKSMKSNTEKTSMDNKAHLEKQKEKLKKANVTPLEDFITVKPSDDESESSLGFDSDEYEKMIESDSGAESDENDSYTDNNENSDDGNIPDDDDLSGNELGEDTEDVDSESDEISEMTPPKKDTMVEKVSKRNSKRQAQKQNIEVTTKHTEKRKPVQKHQAAAKMGKSKETSLRPKQFKKKKQKKII